MANDFKKNDPYYCYGIREKTGQKFLSCTNNLSYVEFGDGEVYYTDTLRQAQKIIKKYYLDPDKHEVVKVYTDGRGDLYLK